MEKRFRKIDNVVIGAVCLFIGSATAMAVPLNQARVSMVIRDVRLLPSKAAARVAIVNDKVIEGTAVRTGAESRTELTFADETITRLGQNTVFSFRGGSREVQLDSGALLMQVPQGISGAQVRTPAVTASITGGTGLLSSHKGYPTKWLILEGVGEFCTKLGDCVTLHAGEMALEMNGHLSGPLKFDVKLVYNTAHLIADFPPLPNEALILQVIDQQEKETGGQQQQAPPPGKDELDLDDLRASASPTATPTATATPTPTATPSATPTPTASPSATPTPTPGPGSTPTPTPSKYGTPSVISSPVPYVVSSGTVISTDPAIRTNGVTDYGKIYRGPADDGAFTLWAYGSTSAFDTELNVDTEFFADTNNLPIAVFKFESLSLTGNPTIDTSNGNTHLALIAVDGITSGPPGGVLTFTGLDLLVLGTVNGSITLTSDVSFQDLATLVIYARGSSSDLTITSPISNIGDLKLAAERSLLLISSGTMTIGGFETESGGDQALDIGGSLLLDGPARLSTVVLPDTFVASGADLTLVVNGDFVNSSTSDYSRFRVKNFGGHIGTGGNLSIYVAGNLMTSDGIIGGLPARPRDGDFPAGDSFNPGDFVEIVQNTSGQIDNGGNIFLLVGSKGSGGDVRVNDLALDLENYDESENPAGHIETGGNIDVSIGGNLTADSSVDVFLNNRGGGSIDSGGNLTFNVNGALTIGAQSDGFSAEFIISNRYDDIGGNTGSSFIGSDVLLDFYAGSVEMAGYLFGSGISNRGGSVIDGNATVTWDVPGSVTIHGNDPTYGGASWFILNDIPPDHQFTPPSGGTIHGDATLTLSIGGDLSVVGYTSIVIDQFRRSDFPNLNGGTIDGNAIMDISAANISIGNDFDIYIGNEKNGGGPGTAGSIGGNAAINLSATGDFSTTGYFDPQILNYNGGTIGQNATIEVNAANISTGTTIDAAIDNRSGDIGADAAIGFATGNLSTQDSANFFLSNDGLVGAALGGHIGGDASITVLASAGIDAGNGAFFAIINDDDGGTTPGGAIDGDALVHVTASHITTEALAASQFNLFGTIHNSGGRIMGDADVMFGISGAITTAGTASFDILNFDDRGGEGIIGGGIIDGDATVTIQAGALSIGDQLLVQIINNGGLIGGNATINMDVSGTATVASDATVAIYGSDSASAAAINFNGGSYNVAGTFLSSIDGDGTIAFNNATAHADILKVGVFGTNGVLNIGGGTLSADTTLKLYATGSNGQLNFVSNVTLGGAGAKILAANSVTIFNNVTVTIGGQTPADVYTNNANYSGFGGNGSTTGTFAGAGANNPQPLASAPPFGVPPSHPSSTAGARAPGHGIHIDSSAQLLTLLDSAPTGRNGRVVVDPRTTRNPGNADHGGTNSRALHGAERAEVRNGRVPGGVLLR